MNRVRRTHPAHELAQAKERAEEGGDGREKERFGGKKKVGWLLPGEPS